MRIVYNLLRDDDDNSTAADIFDGIIILLILLNVGLLVAGTFNTPVWFQQVSSWIESFSVGVFTVEYAARIWTAPLRYPGLSPARARLKLALGFMQLMDLISILPSYIPVLFPVDLRVLRLIRLIRLFRLFKVNRYTHGLDTIAEVFRRKAGQLISSMFAVVLLITMASVLMFGLENHAQPGVFQNALDGLWWALATLTSANYGDIYPITLAGRLLSGAIALLGIGLIAVPTGIISAGFVEVVGEDNAKQAKENSHTPTPLHAHEELQHYKALLDSGALTPAEYEMQKQRILKRAGEK